VGVVVTANHIPPPREPTIDLHTIDEAWYTYFVDGEKLIDADQVFDEALHSGPGSFTRTALPPDRVSTRTRKSFHRGRWSVLGRVTMRQMKSVAIVAIMLGSTAAHSQPAIVMSCKGKITWLGRDER
jgi:hypothetical protein